MFQVQSSFTSMKPNIHPTVFTDTLVTCTGCGTTFTTSSIKKVITVEVCSNCHPYFTGEHRFIDVKGRVDTFQKKQQLAKELKQKFGEKKEKREKSEDREPKTLRELLNEV